MQYISQFQQQYFNLKRAYNNVFTPIYRSKMNSHLSTTCVGATCARIGWNSRHILTPSHIANTFHLKRKINTKFEHSYEKIIWLRTRESSKSSQQSLLKSHPGITSNERTTNQQNEYYTLFAPLYWHEGFGCLQLGTNMTVSLLDIWSHCFVTYLKNDTFRAKIQLHRHSYTLIYSLMSRTHSLYSTYTYRWTHTQNEYAFSCQLHEDTITNTCMHSCIY